MSGGPIIRSAPSAKFSTNWDQVFAAKKPAKAAAKKTSSPAKVKTKSKTKAKPGKKKS